MKGVSHRRAVPRKMLVHILHLLDSRPAEYEQVSDYGVQPII